LLKKAEILINRYQILDTIKIGSKRAVYQAIDLHLPGKIWIIKEFISPSIKTEDKNKFYKEAQNNAGIISQIDYISFPKLIDFFMLNENYYLVFDYIQGKTLRELMNTSTLEKKGKGFLNEDRARELIYQMANTSIYIQKNSIYNLFIEIKPENIIIDTGSILKFIDFGITEELPYNINKLYYTKFFEKGYNIEDDFITIGIMFYFMLTGTKYSGVLEHEETISRESNNIISKCLNKKYSSWEVLLEDLKVNKDKEEKKISNQVNTDDLLKPDNSNKETYKEEISLPINTEDTIKNSRSIEKDTISLKSPLSTLLLFTIVIVILAGIIRLFSYSHTEHIESIEDISETSLFLSPIKPEEFKNRACYYYNLGDYSRAISLFKRQIFNYPSDGEAHIYISNSYVLQEKGEKIYIGLAIPVSGEDIQVGQAIMQGIALALREINSQEEKKFVIIIKDDKSDPDKAREIAIEFVKDDKISAVIGHSKSNTTMAAAKIYNEGRLPVISPVSTNPDISQKGAYIFKTCGNDITQGEILSKIAKKALKVKYVATISNLQEPYSSGLSSSFKSSSPYFTFVCEEHYTNEDKDINEKILNLIKKSPDLVFVASYDIEALHIIKQLREKGYHGYIIGGDALYTQKMINSGGKYANGLICTTFFHPDISNPEVIKFVKAFRKLLGGGTPNPLAAQAYDSTKLLFYATLQGPTDRKNLRNNLSLIGNKLKTFKGVTGEISFDKYGNTKKEWVIVKIENGKFIPFEEKSEQ